jgi:hypothetical protein
MTGVYRSARAAGVAAALLLFAQFRQSTEVFNRLRVSGRRSQAPPNLEGSL